jgi:hypothetical protein
MVGSQDKLWMIQSISKWYFNKTYSSLITPCELFIHILLQPAHRVSLRKYCILHLDKINYFESSQNKEYVGIQVLEFLCTWSQCQILICVIYSLTWKVFCLSWGITGPRPLKSPSAWILHQEWRIFLWQYNASIWNGF